MEEGWISAMLAGCFSTTLPVSIPAGSKNINPAGSPNLQSPGGCRLSNNQSRQQGHKHA